MELKEVDSRKSELIEQFGILLGTEDNLPPLAARILASLIIDNNKGVTFDELVEQMKASKSSVFTNLNILLHKKRLTYYTLPGDRKKYFTVSSDDIADRMDEKIRSCERRIALCKQIIEYKRDVSESDNDPFFSKQIMFLESFVEFMERLRILCLEHREHINNFRK